MKSKTIIKYLINSSHREKQTQWERQKSNISQALRSFPDFSCEMVCEFDSKFVPFIKKLAPMYRYKIKKKNGNLRIDINSSNKSNISDGEYTAFFRGEENGELFLIDNVKKKSLDLLTDLSAIQLDENCDQLLKTGVNNILKQELKFENFKVSQALNWRGNAINEKIGSYKSQKYSIKGEIEASTLKKDYLTDINWKGITNFDEYFDIVVGSVFFEEFLEQSNGKKAFFFNY